MGHLGKVVMDRMKYIFLEVEGFGLVLLKVAHKHIMTEDNFAFVVGFFAHHHF